MTSYSLQIIPNYYLINLVLDFTNLEEILKFLLNASYYIGSPLNSYLTILNLNDINFEDILNPLLNSSNYAHNLLDYCSLSAILDVVIKVIF